jgi:Temperature dependent protein affecting M2 dsRNA replication
LVYDINRVVTDFDWDAKTVTTVSKDLIHTYKDGAFPNDEKAFNDAFLDSCILAGGMYNCPVFPSLAGSLTSMGPVFTFERAIDLLRTYNYDALNTIKENVAESADYHREWARTRCIFTYMPIKTAEGPIVTMSTKNVPNDLATVVMPRLADQIYWYIYRRLVHPYTYDLLISDNIQIHAPLEGGDTQEYRNLLAEMVPLRTTATALVSSHSNRFMHHKHLVSPFEPPHIHIRLLRIGTIRKCWLIFLRTTSSVSANHHLGRQGHGMFTAGPSNPLPRYSN